MLPIALSIFRILSHTFVFVAGISTSFSLFAAEKICAIYPHLKDSYWLSVNYGMVSEAKRNNINLRVLESGGYPNIEKQQQQLSLCKNWGADAILLSTVEPYAYQNSLSHWVDKTPVFATVNDLSLSEAEKPHLKGTVGANWYDMGFDAGDYLAKRYPQEKPEFAKVVLLLGPQSSGGTKPVAQGFYDAVQHSKVKVVKALWSDNDKELQRNLIQQVLAEQEVDYIVGSAVAIEAAISELRSANKSAEIGLISIYLSHGVYRGILRDKVEFATSDQMVQQGRLAVRQALAYLRNEPFPFEEKINIVTLTPDHIEPSIVKNSLSPSKYRPIFEVKAVESE